MKRSTYERQIFPLLTRLDAERVHRFALHGLHLAERLPGGIAAMSRDVPTPDPRLSVDTLGLRFANPIGVAAGLDKDAEAIDALFALGFGSVEIGTVTPRPQPGNPRPRVWRIPGQDAVINAMGFPSSGVSAVRKRLFGRRFPGVIGINLGKNKETSLENAVRDYTRVLDDLWPMGNYVVINVSSPNTPGLRELQGRAALGQLVHEVQRLNRWKADVFTQKAHPVLVKVAPDLDDWALDEVLAGAIDGDADGFIFSNTTIDRSVLTDPHLELPGGVSGKPLRARANALLMLAYGRLGESDRRPLIGVGGISTAEDVIERMKAGASLVQIYTGFVYGGPGLPARILRELQQFCDREGIESISEIVGTTIA
ncbi:MAG: quinone-dependent dihydroorotate dehydrogenase [Sphaerobacteraceae bacterium]|nr:MAG: quinone-dependent dihydroorotate dehydrogenase [Sphaerobacteraceae bacterium]